MHDFSKIGLMSESYVTPVLAAAGGNLLTSTSLASLAPAAKAKEPVIKTMERYFVVIIGNYYLDCRRAKSQKIQLKVTAGSRKEPPAHGWDSEMPMSFGKIHEKRQQAART